MRVAFIASFIALAASMPASSMPPGGGSSPPPSQEGPSSDASRDYSTGLEALKANRFADAKKSFQKVLRVIPDDANANLLAGLAAAGLNDLKSAARYYERATKSDGKLVLGHRELAITYAKLGDRAKADARLAKLRQLESACRGTCAEAQQIKDAIAAVTAALAQPTQARLDTGSSLLFAGTEGGDRAYLDAVALINERRYDDAIVSLRTAQTTFGAHPDILTYLGFAHRKLRQFEEAELYYRQALAIAPDHKGATEYYGELMIERGDVAGARGMLAKLDAMCTFGCAEADELRRWVKERRAPAS